MFVFIYTVLCTFRNHVFIKVSTSKGQKFIKQSVKLTWNLAQTYIFSSISVIQQNVDNQKINHLHIFNYSKIIRFTGVISL
jgi:hypothetical protein